MALRIQIAKFKFRQYPVRANSPNSMLAKLSRYTVLLNHLQQSCPSYLCMPPSTSTATPWIWAPSYSNAPTLPAEIDPRLLLPKCTPSSSWIRPNAHPLQLKRPFLLKCTPSLQLKKTPLPKNGILQLKHAPSSSKSKKWVYFWHYPPNMLIWQHSAFN